MNRVAEKLAENIEAGYALVHVVTWEEDRARGVAKRAVITTSAADPQIWDLTLDTNSLPR